MSKSSIVKSDSADNVFNLYYVTQHSYVLGRRDIQYFQRPVRPDRPRHLDTLTKPNQALTIHDILQRYVKGLAIPRIPMMNTDLDLSPFDKLDVFERKELSKQYAARVEALNAELTGAKLKAAQDKAKADFEREVQNKVDTVLKQERDSSAKS